MTLAELMSALQELEREHGPDCSVRTFDLALYKGGYMHRVTFDYPAEREAQAEPTQVLHGQAVALRARMLSFDEIAARLGVSKAEARRLSRPQ